jgi:hypothetical protein
MRDPGFFARIGPGSRVCAAALTLCKLKCFPRPVLQRARDTGFIFTMSNSPKRMGLRPRAAKRAGEKQEVEAPRGAGADRRTLACNDAARRNT